MEISSVVKTYDFKGMLCREGTMDEHVVREMSTYRVEEMTPGWTVLDLGAHIGAFTRRVILTNGGRVIAVEPNPDNWAMFSANWARLPDPSVVTAYNAAAVMGEQEPIELFLNNGKNTGSHSIKPYKRRASITVQTVNLADLLSAFSPDAIKMDVEGAEYELLTPPLPQCVVWLAIEIHRNIPGSGKEKSILLDEHIRSQGFKLDRPVNITGGAWCVTGVYRR